MVFNFANPWKEFVFEGDAIEHVQAFKYLGILLEITSNLDMAVEHLVVANKRSLFALNRRCAKLCIMNVKLHCDLFTTFHNKLCMWGLGGFQENKGYWSNVPRVPQVPAQGAKNN
jgi:hypothetical protein